LLIKVRRVWVVEATSEIVPDTDLNFYDTKCEDCLGHPADGVARSRGRFLCLDCLKEELNREPDSKYF
jgi:hypothetical protein